MQRLPEVQEKLLLNIAGTFLHGICPLRYFLGIPAAPILDQSSSLWLVSLPPFAPVSLQHTANLRRRPSLLAASLHQLGDGGTSRGPFFFFSYLFKPCFSSSLKWGQQYLTDKGRCVGYHDFCKPPSRRCSPAHLLSDSLEAPPTLVPKSVAPPASANPPFPSCLCPLYQPSPLPGLRATLSCLDPSSSS